jgi:hypothetical protein
MPTDLAKIHALRVISRTSVMQFKGTTRPLPEIARMLNVDKVVEGSVLRSGDRVRITAQLIDAPSDRHLWSETYERPRPSNQRLARSGWRKRVGIKPAHFRHSRPTEVGNQGFTPRSRDGLRPICPSLP